MSTIIDNYEESNFTGGLLFYNYQGFGQSFTGNGMTLDQTKFYLNTIGSTSGLMTSKVYSHSGIFGESSVPGELLATSASVDVATVGSSYSLISFPFYGLNRILLENETYYVVTMEYAGGDNLVIGFDDTSKTHPGVECSKLNGSETWYVLPPPLDYDLIFYVYGSSSIRGISSITGISQITL